MSSNPEIPAVADLRAWALHQSPILRDCGHWLGNLGAEPTAWVRRWRPLEPWFGLVNDPDVRALLLGAFELMEVAGTEQVPADPLSLARRVLVIDWLCRDPESDPVAIGARATRFALPQGTRLMTLGNFGGKVVGVEAFLSPDLDDACEDAQEETGPPPGDCREHIGIFMHSAECEYWPGARYTWPQVVAQTWNGIRSEAMIRLPEFFTAG